MKELKRRLLSEKETLKQYLLAKFWASDWHGVQDAASDLRDIDSQLQIIAMVGDLENNRLLDNKIG